MPNGIPTDTGFTTVNTVRHLSLIDLPEVNVAIDTVSAQMLDQGWSRVGLYASTTMTIDLPLVGTDLITNFALWITNFEGHVYEVYDTTLGQRDPTGDITGGLPVLGIGVRSKNFGETDSSYQTMLVNALISKMNAAQAIWIVSGINVGGTFNTFQDLLVTAVNPGPSYNDVFMSANVNGAGNFNGLPKGGGWIFTSVPTPGNGSTVSVSLVNRSGIGNFTANVNFNVGGEIIFHHSPAEYVLYFKPDYWSVVMPYQWILFHADDGSTYVPHNIEEVLQGGDNLWICNPRIPDAQLNDLTNPIGYCGFEVIKNRGVPYEGVSCSTCINSTFTEGPFSAFEVDMGVSILVLNAMHHAAGELATTAGKSITLSSLVALSTAAGGPLQIVGDVWGMYITTQYVPLDKLSMSNDNSHQMIALRSQDAPCSMTLWCAIS